MNTTSTPSRSLRNVLLAAVLATGAATHAQQTTLWLEEFDGGASTTGFTIDQLNVTDCRWEYAPDSVSAFDFSQDFAGFWPAGPGFDSSFVFLDSDACGGTSVVVNSYITSAPFDAALPGSYWLHYTHQFRARLASFCRVDASADGITWTQVANYTTTDVGYPNPAVIDSVDISVATASSATAQVRFQFSAGWDWWWALDSISVTFIADPQDVLDPVAGQHLRVYPNPVNDVLFVQYAGNDVLNAEVFDMVGRRVLHQRASRSIPVEALSTGTYTLVLHDAFGAPVARTRFVKR